MRDLVHEEAVFRQFLAHHPEHRRLRRVVAAELPVEAALEPQQLLLARLALAVGAFQSLGQRAQSGADVGMQRHAWRAPARERGFVRVQPHHRQRLVQAPFQLRFAEPRAHGQHRVRLGPQRVSRRQADSQRVAFVDDALRVEVRGGWRLQHLGHAQKLRAGIQRSGPGDDDRILRTAEHARRLPDCVRVGFHRFISAGGFKQRHLAFAFHHVRRHFQRHRKRGPGMQLPERLRHQLRCVAAARNALGPFRKPLENAELVVNLVQHAPALVDVLRGHLPGQAQHPRVGGVGGGQRRAGIEHAGAGHHAEHAGPAGGGGVAQRHVGRALLVARVDHLDGALVLRQRVEQSVGLPARQPEHRVHPMRQHRAHQRLAPRHPLTHREKPRSGSGFPPLFSGGVGGRMPTPSPQGCACRRTPENNGGKPRVRAADANLPESARQSSWAISTSNFEPVARQNSTASLPAAAFSSEPIAASKSSFGPNCNPTSR